ncbi:type II toxin-antitoxin system RelE/ParE family toxin [Microlunatus elymi]|uniref:Type II toxin-antitoxin system RelE/ParE family toxin n=1 Tax=Microlunatus elymi TaxID=2596828 RepID=A0A516Q2X0_9ACTN|nr:type II toxin-antitoxin system RelE/ParE family toxin [Microlunatus elymi]QDP97732.1 type II toxin-antitoxin system RelE/ParE family toxin [Microlunatus elymi]
MTYRWSQLDEARTELREAASFLEDEREGWGDRFIDAVEAAIASIVESPHTWALHRGKARTPPVHTRSVAGFRYDIKYLVHGEEVVIIAYAHERRRPEYWARRVTS